MDLGKLSEISDHRTCLSCGAQFQTNDAQSALEQFSDHSTIHQPTPVQWVRAHTMIQDAKQNHKSGEGQNTRQPATAVIARNS